MISPPSSWTVGRILESSNSLIIATVSSSSSLISVSALGECSCTTGIPLAKKSIMTANISGFKILHSASSCFETVTKSPPKKTERTPSMRNKVLQEETIMQILVWGNHECFLYLTLRLLEETSNCQDWECLVFE